MTPTYWELNQGAPDEEPVELTFACACGTEGCIGYDRDPLNLRIGSEWFAADCAVANQHPEVVRDRMHLGDFEQRRR